MNIKSHVFIVERCGDVDMWTCNENMKEKNKMLWPVMALSNNQHCGVLGWLLKPLECGTEWNEHMSLLLAPNCVCWTSLIPTRNGNNDHVVQIESHVFLRHLCTSSESVNRSRTKCIWCYGCKNCRGQKRNLSENKRRFTCFQMSALANNNQHCNWLK